MIFSMELHARLAASRLGGPEKLLTVLVSEQKERTLPTAEKGSLVDEAKAGEDQCTQVGMRLRPAAVNNIVLIRLPPL